jgi:hypothetical protein
MADRKKPGAEPDDDLPLEDTDQEEIDIDALLADDVDARHDSLEEESGEALDAGDDLDLSAPEAMTSGGEEASRGEEPALVALEDLIDEGGSSFSTVDAVVDDAVVDDAAVEDAAVEDIAGEPLPGDDFGVTEDLPIADSGDYGEDGGSGEGEEGGVGEDTAAVGAGGDTGAEMTGAKAGKAGKAGGRSGKKLQRSLEKVKKPGKSGRAERPSRARAPEKAAVAAASKGSIPFICSECYEEFLLPTSYSQETVTCPECLHVGKRPDADFLRTVTVHRRSEKKSLAGVLVVALLLLGVVTFLVWLRSPYGTLELSRDMLTNVSYGLLGGALLLTGIMMWLLVRFEGNRWEVYF